eukprot:1161638-Prymnesium_polylepis.1
MQAKCKMRSTISPSTPSRSTGTALVTRNTAGGIKYVGLKNSKSAKGTQCQSTTNPGLFLI